MKRILIAAACALSFMGQAFAADLPQAPPPPPRAAAYIPVAPPPFSWTGFYIGANMGAGRNHGNLNDSFGLFAGQGANNSTTFLGGGQLGANYQFNMVVLGVEGDFDWLANNNNSGSGTTVGSTALSGSNNGRWLTELVGRLGIAVDRALIYGKGGAAWTGSNNYTLLNVPTGATASFGNSNTNAGWAAGGGVEWAFSRNWTAKLEYTYVGMSNSSFPVPAGFGALTGDVFTASSHNIQMVTVGVNYLFNSGF
jgi:outer membrane immunogenic protein